MKELFRRIKLTTMKRPVLSVVIVLLIVLIGFSLVSDDRNANNYELSPRAGELKTEESVQIWTCSMHPNIRLPEPGRCPICGMELIPLQMDNNDKSGSIPVINLSPAAVSLAEIKVEPVKRLKIKTAVDLTGKVNYDESRISTIAARFPGRLEKLYIDYTGQSVHAGEPIAEIYSPDLLATQEELIQAYIKTDEYSKATPTTLSRFFNDTFEAAKQKLLLWDLTKDQIVKILKENQPSDTMIIYSPVNGVVIEKMAVVGKYIKTGTEIYKLVDISTVWIEAEAFESDLPFIHIGEEASVTTESFPGEQFNVAISFISPVLNEKTRTVQIRMEASNHEYRLKPGMLAKVRIEAGYPKGNESVLVVPTSAPLITGKRAIVYIQVLGEKGIFEGREIVLGPRAGDYYVVLSGIHEGENVVVNGNFKIDSAVQILAKPSMMSPGEY